MKNLPLVEKVHNRDYPTIKYAEYGSLPYIYNIIKGEDNDLSVVLRQLGEDFQIKATDAMAVALWTVARFYKNPEEAIIKVVSFGGDTDTTAAIVSIYGINF